jgi:hypothetical protein
MTPSGATNNTVRILKVSEEATITPQGQHVTKVRIDFNVGSHGPFTERFEKATFDPVSANAALVAFASKLGSLGGL